MKKKIDFEFKVGIFVAIGIAIFISMVFSIGSVKTFQQRKSLKLRFDFANGVETSAPVRLAGVQVGEVKNINVIFDEKKQKNIVELDTLIDKRAVIEEDAEAFINSLGFVGERYVEILPGTAGSRRLKAGETLQGKQSVPLEKITEKGYEALSGFGDTMKHLNKVVGDPETQEAFKATMLDLRKLVGSANVVMDQVKAGEGTIGKLFMDDKVYKELEDFIKDLKAHPWKLLYKPRGGK